MYSKVHLINKFALLMFFMLFIGMASPAHSTNVGWTNYSTQYGTTIQIYSNSVTEQVKVQITVSSSDVSTFLYLNYGLNTQDVASTGGTYTIVAKTVSLEIIGAATGQYEVTELGSGANALAQQMGTLKFALFYFLMPIVVTILLMAFLYFNWRNKP